MRWLFGVDWEHVLVPKTPLLEMFIRGTLMYLILFALLRVVLKRERGERGLTDLLVLVLIADAAQNAMADDCRSIPDGAVLVATIIFWYFALQWLGYRVPALRRLLRPPPLLLVRDGRMIEENMKRELITEEELRAQLREAGVTDLGHVKEIYMEGDGTFSILAGGQEKASKGRPGKASAI